MTHSLDSEGIRRITPADRIRMPWANGLGFTEEIARGRAGSQGRPSWRLSVAELRSDSDFSALPGESGVTLDFAGIAHDVAPLEPLAFPGERAPGCRITSATEAFNVMVERESVTAAVTETDVAETTTLPDSTAVFIACGSGVLDGISAEQGDCFLTTPAPRTFHGTARLLLVELTPTT